MYLQKILFPSVGLNSEELMYFRPVGPDFPFMSVDGQGLHLQKGYQVSSDTFYNGLTVHTWKKHTCISDLFLELSGTGKFILQIGVHCQNLVKKWLGEFTIDLDTCLDQSSTQIDLTSIWNRLDEGILFFKIIAVTDVSLLAGGWLTHAPEAVGNIKLGIVITHFNRKDDILPVIQRITNFLQENGEESRNTDLVVVDNSSNITRDEIPSTSKVHLLPNSNLGGSGGFMRGLLFLKEHNYTHCLFMDDDASCEVESIRRAWALLTLVTTKNFAIAGSLLREAEPYRLFEKGAQFNGFCQPLKNGLDMRLVADLVIAEKNDQKPHYGGWWFYAFKICEVRHYAFPFFVRGDDILFGLANKHNICTINGIGCWGDDFSVKSGPLPIYLDVRNHLIQKIYALNAHLLGTWIVVCKFFCAAIFSYNYATAQAVRIALEHIMDGERFWIDNLDMSEIRSKINSLQPLESMSSMDIANISYTEFGLDETIFRYFIRLVTLNGFLLPSIFLKNITVRQNKGFRAAFRSIFLAKKVVYYDERSRTGYVAEHNKKCFFLESLLFLKASVRFFMKFHSLKAEYQRVVPNLSSEKFWQKTYGGLR